MAEQATRPRRPAALGEHPTKLVIREVRKAHDASSSHTHDLIQDALHVPDALKRLAEHDEVELVVGERREAVIEVGLHHVQPAPHAVENGPLVDLDAHDAIVPPHRQPRQQGPAAAAEVQDARRRRDQLDDPIAVQPLGMVRVEDARRAWPPGLASLPSARRTAAEVGQKAPDQLAVGLQIDGQQERVVPAVADDVAVTDRLARRDQGVNDLLELLGREQPVAGEADRQPAALAAIQGRRQLPCRPAKVEEVHRHGKRDVRVGVEPLDELRALVAEVRADGELLLERNGHVPWLAAVCGELLLHGLSRQVGDVPDHSRYCQADVRPGPAVAVSAVAEVGVVQDRIPPNHVERQRLARRPGRRGDGNRAPHAVGVPDGPQEHLEPAHRPAGDGQKAVNAEMVEQPALDLDRVADCYGGEVRPVGPARCRVDRVRPGRAPTAAKHVGTDHEVAIGIDRLARPDRDVPPARIVLLAVHRDVRVAAQGVADQHGVVPGGVEPAVRLVRDGDLPQPPAQLQVERLVRGHALGMPQGPARADAVAALEKGLVHLTRYGQPFL